MDLLRDRLRSLEVVVVPVAYLSEVDVVLVLNDVPGLGVALIDAEVPYGPGVLANGVELPVIDWLGV